MRSTTSCCALLNERARLVQEVGKLKAQLKQPFYVPERERQILERLQAANAGPFPTEALRPVFSEIISACLSLEHPLRVAFLGPEATFTHMAARSRFGLSARYVPAATVAGVFTEVEKGAGRSRRRAHRELDRGRGQLDARRAHRLGAVHHRRDRDHGEPLPAHALGDARGRAEGLFASAGAGAVPRAGCRRTCRTWRRSRWRRRRWRRA